MSWNNNHEQIVINIGEQCAGYQWMLTKATQDNLYLYRLVGLAAIPFAILSGTGYFAIKDQVRLQEVLFGIFGATAATLISIQQFMDFRNDNQQYVSLANKFQELYNDITFTLATEPENRTNPNDYIPNLLNKYDIICDTRPVLSGYIANQYRAYLKKEGINMSVPDIVGTVKPILINNEEVKRKQDQCSVEISIIPQDPEKEKFKRQILDRARAWMGEQTNTH